MLLAIGEAVALPVVDELVCSNAPTVSAYEPLDVVLDKFARSETASLPVADPEDPAHIRGLITHQAAIRRYQEELDRQTR